MSREVMIVAIAGMATFLLVVQMIWKAEIEKARARSAGSADLEAMRRLLADSVDETSRLRARVEVLERLATDGDRKLAGEIDRLRSEQRV